MVGDAARGASRMKWKMAALLAAGSFVTFYLALPWWLRSRIDKIQTAALRPVIEAILGRRAHWIELLGLALTLVFGYFAVRNYLALNGAGASEVRATTFLGRLIAKILQ
jgi:hypothetical protein